MQYTEREIKKGIKLHLIKIFLGIPVTRENVTKNSLISAILRRGSKNMPSSIQISKELEEMYGASFNCGIDKTGDNQIIKFYIESINDNFLPQKNENMLKKSLEKIFEIVFNPLVDNNGFNSEYLEQEKANIKRIIDGKPDNKAQYSLERCIEEMYNDKPYGLYKYGYVEDLKEITSQELYKYYKEMIQQCKIDIFVSGEIDEETVKIVEENENIKSLEDRDNNIKINMLEEKKCENEQEIIEELEVTQGKLVIGLDLKLDSENQRYAAMLYNSILGGSATSKMFQEVREKASLAYTASSSYARYKSNIFIRCGIEIKNYENQHRIYSQFFN